jgi:polar amino acid transport system substrate-binding protein
MNGTRTRSRWQRSAALAAGLAMIVAACAADDSGVDGDADPGLDEETDEVETDDEATDADADTEATGLLAELQEAGSITVGVANEVPFGYLDDDGEPTGIAPDVARAVLAELGIDEMNAQVVEFGQLIGGLQAGQFDMITAGMYITPERAEQIEFSDPDYCIPESLGVPPGNPDGLEDYQSVVDNPDITIAVATGTVELDYAQDAGIGEDQIELFGDIDSMYRALEAGEVDAVTGTAATVQTYANASEDIEAIDSFFPVDADGEDVFPCGGHGFADEDFRDAFNEVLNEFREDGTTMEIITSYEDFTEDDVELANTLTLEDFLD